jgi:hypothetical protein
MLGIWRSKAVESACEAPRNAVYEWKSWDGWYVKALLPDVLHVEAWPKHESQDVMRLLPTTVRRFLFHLDLTDTSRFPVGRHALLEALEARSIRAVNAKPTDLSKRAVQKLCRRLDLPSSEASPDGDGEELLIVKSDFNYGGRSERLLSRGQRKLLGARKPGRAIRNAFDYRVALRGRIRESLWRDPEVFIERFIDNREHRLWRARISLDRYVFSTGVSPRQVKKLAHCSGCTEFFLRKGEFRDELPAALLETVYRFAESFGLEFGALDIVPDDAGNYFIIDANTTPGMGYAVEDRMAFLREPWEQDPQ